MSTAVLGLLIALATLCVSLLGSLIAVTWRAAAHATTQATLTTTMQTMIAELKLAIENLREDLKQLKAIPLLEQRISTLEKLHDSLSHKVSSVWQKLFSHDRHIAVVAERQRPGSSPDLSSHLIPREEAD
jgi:C4-dicarboxylate-specific signal transduction histidine kinase